MLRSMKDLDGLAVEATDGAIDHVKDFYFDDSAWVVRYLVVETGSWLSSRKVLISPISIGHPDWGAKTLPVSITSRSRTVLKSTPKGRSRASTKPSISATTATHSIGVAVGFGARATHICAVARR